MTEGKTLGVDVALREDRTLVYTVTPTEEQTAAMLDAISRMRCKDIVVLAPGEEGVE